jgi:hypothetical protein
MELATLLQEEREAVLVGKWRELIVRSYPQLTSAFLTRQGDPFQNPVGHAITSSVGPIYDQVVSAMDTDELLRALDWIIRIRSVQDFTPSEAVAFIFELKTAIRATLDGQIIGPEDWQSLGVLESRIDRVALLAFEKYTQCREQLHKVRKGDLKRRADSPLEKVRCPMSQPEREPSDGDA